MVYTSALAGEAMNTPQTLMREYVLGAVSSETPLPPDPAGEARLATAVAGARSGPEPDAPELPETVDGVRYDFRANDVGNTSFVIRFEDNSAILSSEDADGITDLTVGMDGRFLTSATLPVAVRGEWRDENTSVIEYRVLGQVERGTIEFTFEDDIARVTSWQSVGGTTETIVADRTF